MIEKCFTCNRTEKKYSFPKSLFFSDIKIGNCTKCQKKCCSKCSRTDGGFFCPSCNRKRIEEEERKEEERQIAINSVEIVSINYKGFRKTYGNKIHIDTEYYKDKNDAIYELKEIAYENGCNIVIEVKEDRDTDEDDNYVYSIWSYSGIATNKE